MDPPAQQPCTQAPCTWTCRVTDGVGKALCSGELGASKRGAWRWRAAKRGALTSAAAAVIPSPADASKPHASSSAACSRSRCTHDAAHTCITSGFASNSRPCRCTCWQLGVDTCICRLSVVPGSGLGPRSQGQVAQAAVGAS